MIAVFSQSNLRKTALSAVCLLVIGGITQGEAVGQAEAQTVDPAFNVAHPMAKLAKLESSPLISGKQGRHYLKMTYDTGIAFARAQSELSALFGAPGDVFSGESVWYPNNPGHGSNSAKVITVQLKYDETGNLVVLADGRLAQDRGGPLLVGPKNALENKPESAAAAQQKSEQQRILQDKRLKGSDF